MSTAHLKEPHSVGYGYQIWVDDREGAFMFQGAFGQILAVIPGKDMGIAYTSGANHPERDYVWEHVWSLLVDRVDTAEPAAAEEEEKNQLELERITAGLKKRGGTNRESRGMRPGDFTKTSQKC